MTAQNKESRYGSAAYETVGQPAQIKYHFDLETGVLEISATKEDVLKLRKSARFPIEVLSLGSSPIYGSAYCKNVTDIRPLPHGENTSCYYSKNRRALEDLIRQILERSD